MQTITATEAKNKLGSVIARAQREPIVIQNYNKDAAVIISPQDYERLTRLNLKEFQAFRENVADKAAKLGLTYDKLTELLD
jgi:prevent-host-death family protein